MSTNSKNKAIAIAMIQLGHNMNLKVLAEGVEHKAELDILVESNCDLIQGHLFSKALPAIELESLLLQDQRLIM
jgi:EAL domain-containing protein (putative c-di-GMP-specific phosphodiesterase class I)